MIRMDNIKKKARGSSKGVGRRSPGRLSTGKFQFVNATVRKMKEAASETNSKNESEKEKESSKTVLEHGAESSKAWRIRS